MVERKPTAQRARILVVDDLPQNRRLLVSALSPTWTVLEAETGIEAVELARTAEVDLVLLDVMMPGMNGFETCRRIKSQPREVFLPVILVTALSEQEDRNRGLQTGADDFLRKPIDLKELLLRVRAFLRLRGQEQIIHAQIEALRTLDHLKDDMVSLLVHDLRSPLAAILAMLELTVETVAEPQLREDLMMALETARLLRSRLDETLLVRLFEENAITARRELTDLGALIRGTLASLAPEARRRKVELRLALSGECIASVDPKLLQRSVENLLSNALKYTAAGTEVLVAARCDGGAVEIDVQDRGPGIPAGHESVLFERFGSVEAHRGNERRGIGLGLYLVKLVAAAHGGDVSVHDRAGGGSVFRLRLLDVSDELPATELPPAPADAA